MDVGNIARLGLAIERSQADAAAKSLDTLTASASRTEKAAHDVERAFKSTQEAAAAMASAIQRRDPFQRTIMQSSEAAVAFNRVNTASVDAGRGMTRMAFGVQTLAMSMQGGRVSAQGFLGSLHALGLGSPEFLAASAGLAILGTLILQLGENAEDAQRKASESFATILTEARRVSTEMGRLHVAQLEAERSGLRARTSLGVDRFGEERISDPDSTRRQQLTTEIEQWNRAIALAGGERLRDQLVVGRRELERLIDLFKRGGAEAKRAAFDEPMRKFVDEIKNAIQAQEILNRSLALTAKQLQDIKRENEGLKQPGSTLAEKLLVDESQVDKGKRSGLGSLASSFFSSGGGLAGFAQLAKTLPGIGQAAGFASDILGGLKDALFGGGEAAAQFTRHMEALKKTVEGTASDLYKQEQQVEEERRSLIKEALNVGDYNQVVEINRLEDQRLRQLREEAGLLRTQRFEDLQVRQLRAHGDADLADAAELAFRHQREYNEAVKAGADVLERQRILEVQRAEAVKLASDQIQHTLDGLSQTIADLKTFQASLALNQQLTILSPVAQLREARRQYNEILLAAQGGDQTAAGKLPAAAQAFLQASRAVNASGVAYIQDFNRVRSDVDAVSKLFIDQKSIAEQQLEELKKISQNTGYAFNPGSGGPGTPGSYPQNPNIPGPGNPNIPGGFGPFTPTLLSAFMEFLVEDQAERKAQHDDLLTALRMGFGALSVN